MTLFRRLLAEPGVREELALRSGFGFMAFHGGSLEEMTDVIADEAARRAGASAYVVVLPPGLHWHVPSRLVRPDGSAALARFLAHVDVVVSVHGYGRADHRRSLLLGGSNRRLADHVGRHLAAALPDYLTVTELTAIPWDLRGVHPENPVNRARGGGVQLALPARVRVRQDDAEALVTALAEAARCW